MQKNRGFPGAAESNQGVRREPRNTRTTRKRFPCSRVSAESAVIRLISSLWMRPSAALRILLGRLLPYINFARQNSISTIPIRADSHERPKIVACPFVARRSCTPWLGCRSLCALCASAGSVFRRARKRVESHGDRL